MSTISKWAERLRAASDFNDTSLRALVIRGASGTFALRVFTLGTGFVIRFLLARTLGAAGLGIYHYALAWVDVLMIFTVFGFNRLLVREVAVYQARDEWGAIRGLLRFTQRTALLVSLGCIVVTVAVGVWSFDRQQAQLQSLFYGLPTSVQLTVTRMPLHVLILSMILLPLWSLNALRMGAMQGLRRIIHSQFPELVMRPLLILGLLLLVYLLLGSHLSPLAAVIVNIAASSAALIYGNRMLRRQVSSHVEQPAFHVNTWLQAAAPLFLLDAVNTISGRTDSVLLGALLGARDVGIYGVALQLAQLMATVLMAANTALAPNIARLAETHQMDRLQKIITQTTRSAFVLSLGMGVVLLLLSESLLGIFGPEFVRARGVLAILVVGQLVNSFCGSVGTLLVMTGHPRDNLIGLGSGSVLNVVLTLLFIPRWGIEGSALATALSMMLWNIILTYLVWKRLKINSTVLGKVLP